LTNSFLDVVEIFEMDLLFTWIGVGFLMFSSQMDLGDAFVQNTGNLYLRN